MAAGSDLPDIWAFKGTRMGLGNLGGSLGASLAVFIKRTAGYIAFLWAVESAYPMRSPFPHFPPCSEICSKFPCTGVSFFKAFFYEEPL